MSLDVLFRKPDCPGCDIAVLAIQQVTEIMAARLEEHDDQRLLNLTQGGQRNTGLALFGLPDEKAQQPPPLSAERILEVEGRVENDPPVDFRSDQAGELSLYYRGVQ
ncbi:hypothetical protein D3C81_2085580 [compost metagenome]